VETHDDVPQKATVTNWTDEGKFIIKFVNGGEELKDYNDLINRYNQEMYAFQKILDHKKSGNSCMIKILWDNGEITWEKMKSIKESDPLTLAKYSHENQLYNLNGWKWTKRHKQNPNKLIRILRIFKAKTIKAFKKYKFGVRIPRSVPDALRIDKGNGNNLWLEAINEELEELMKMDTFIFKDSIKEIPHDNQFIPTHLIFDAKYDGRRKARLVAGGNHTEVDAIDTYSGVVSIETVRILFLIADLYFLEVIAADISNAYLYAKTKEKVYTKIDVGKLSGKVLIIDKAQYGLKSSAARFHDICAEVLTKLRFHPTLADSDLWFKDCGEHYEYVTVYVEDLIIASKNPMQIIEELKKVGSFKLKGVGVPEYYLGGNIDRSMKPDKDGCKTKISAKTYIVNVCEKIERMFDTKLRNYFSPLEGGYHPELDTSELVSDEDISKYRMLIRLLNWAVTLGRFDVMFAAVKDI